MGPAPYRPAARHARRRAGIRLLSAMVVIAALSTPVVLGSRKPSDRAVLGSRKPSDRAVLGVAQSSVLVAWTTSSVDSGLARVAAQVPGVSAVAEVRGGMGWLTSWSAEGAAPAVPAEGLLVPVEIAAVDPARYSRLVRPADRAAFARLTGGGALLSRSGAALRGIKERGTLVFGTVTVPVIGVVDDALMASHELIMSRQTAAALGIAEPKYVLIAPDAGTTLSAVRQALAPKISRGRKLGLRSTAESPILRPGGQGLPQVQMKKIFGEFSARPGRGAALTIDPRWIQASIVNASIPLLGTVRCNKLLIPALRGAFNQIVNSNLGAAVRKKDFGGCFAPRNLDTDPDSGISRHAWGAAVDFNVSKNLPGQPPTMDPRLVKILQRWGFTWGGSWLYPDGMHFEYLRKPLPGTGGDQLVEGSTGIKASNR